MDHHKQFLIQYITDYVTGATLPELDLSEALAILKADLHTLIYIRKNATETTHAHEKDLMASFFLLSVIAGIQGENQIKQLLLKGLKILRRLHQNFELREDLMKFFDFYASIRIPAETRNEVYEYIVSQTEYAALQNLEDEDGDQANTPTSASTPAAAIDAPQSDLSESRHRNREMSVEPWATESEYWTAPESANGSIISSPWSERDGLPPPYALSEGGFCSYESRIASLT